MIAKNGVFKQFKIFI